MRLLERLGKQIDSSGEPPDDGGMEKRVEKLESELTAIKVDLAVIKDNYATKADLHEMTSSLIKWMVGTAVGLGAAAITVMTFVLNNATPKAAPSMTPAPIVIYAQPTGAAPQSPSAKP